MAFLLTVMPARSRASSAFPAGEAVGAQVHQDEVGVGAPGHQAVTPFQEFLGQGPGVGHGLVLIVFEGRRQGLLEGHGLGGNDVHQGAALNPGKDLAIQGFAIFGLGQDESAPGSPQGLVGGGSDKVRHQHGIGMETRADEPGDVGHVHHEIGLHLPGDLGEPGKIQGAGIGAGPGDDQLGAVLQGEFPARRRSPPVRSAGPRRRSPT